MVNLVIRFCNLLVQGLIHLYRSLVRWLAWAIARGRPSGQPARPAENPGSQARDTSSTLEVGIGRNATGEMGFLPWSEQQDDEPRR